MQANHIQGLRGQMQLGVQDKESALQPLQSPPPIADLTDVVLGGEPRAPQLQRVQGVHGQEQH